MISRENPIQTRKAAALPTTEHAAASKDQEGHPMTNQTNASIAPQAGQVDPRRLATAQGTAYPPAPGRTRTAIAVRCPYCEHTHMHAVERLPRRGPLLKSPACAPWRTYAVELVAIDLTGQVAG